MKKKYYERAKKTNYPISFLKSNDLRDSNRIDINSYRKNPVDMRLFSYCMPVDDGAAPNPFWGTCTLTVCKPKIRSVAAEDDWVIGIGSVNVGGVNFAGKLVYAMKVTRVLTLQKYNDYCLTSLTKKIPDLSSSDYRRKVGDCIYNYSKQGVITQRPGVHNEDHQPTDLGGGNALLSKHFYYFGVNAVRIPSRFSILIRQGRSHQSTKNEAIKDAFVKWIEGKYERNKIYGDPQVELIFTKDSNGEWCRSPKSNYICAGKPAGSRVRVKC